MNWNEFFGGEGKEEQKSAFLNMFLVMIADGKVTPREKELLYAFRQKIGISEQEANQALEDYKNNKITFTPPKAPEKRAEHLVDLVFMMLADGRIDPTEAKMVEGFAVRLGFERGTVPMLVKSIIENIAKKLGRGTVVQNIQRHSTSNGF